jgi:hypothetical protein
MAMEIKNTHQMTKALKATATKIQGREARYLGIMTMVG